MKDGYEILDEISINNKIPFDKLLEIITGSILENTGKVHIKKIYLFGSHAYGKPTKYSDIDICVVISNNLNKNKTYFSIAKELYRKKISSLDILVYNEKEYTERKDQPGIVHTIFSRGRTIYG